MAFLDDISSLDRRLNDWFYGTIGIEGEGRDAYIDCMGARATYCLAEQGITKALAWMDRYMAAAEMEAAVARTLVLSNTGEAGAAGEVVATTTAGGVSTGVAATGLGAILIFSAGAAYWTHEQNKKDDATYAEAMKTAAETHGIMGNVTQKSAALEQGLAENQAMLDGIRQKAEQFDQGQTELDGMIAEAKALDAEIDATLERIEALPSPEEVHAGVNEAIIKSREQLARNRAALGQANNPEIAST